MESSLDLLAYLLGQHGREGADLDPGSSYNSSSKSKKMTTRYFSATCPDPECGTKLYFPSREASVECTSCGQRHSASELKDRRELKGEEGSVGVEIAQFKKKYSSGRKTPELVKVKGISNYECKLLSPLLSYYGMKDDRAMLLREMNQGESLDCAKLCHRTFFIDPLFLDTIAYGRDRSGSGRYLRETLEAIHEANGANGKGREELLVPLHADGDGHCLVHAVSRCVVGRELFWHSLRISLHRHLSDNRAQYAELFTEFISKEEWDEIIAEADPNFQPSREDEAVGLRNIHIFGLANVLRRPIVLLDSLSGMSSSGDYSGIFLPALHSSEDTGGNLSHGSGNPPSPSPSSPTAIATTTATATPPSQQQQHGPPIVIGWSSSGRNHFIPLVSIKGRPLPRLPPRLQPKVWGVPDALLSRYVALDGDGGFLMCGGKPLSDQYLNKLVQCMDQLFLKKNSVSTSLVADFNQFVCRSAGYTAIQPDVVIDCTRSAVEDKRLYRCLVCAAVSCVPAEWIRKGGKLYNQATDRYTLTDGKAYQFPFDSITARYNETDDILSPIEVSCFWCSYTTRPIAGDGSIVYQNGDRTTTPAVSSKCGCGYKHYWDGKEYDNLPQRVPLSLTWGGVNKSVNAYWFQNESDPSHNSNVYELANKIVCDNFPGEFGSERLVQQAVDSILRATEKGLGVMEQVKGHHPTPPTTPEDEKFAGKNGHPLASSVTGGNRGEGKEGTKHASGSSASSSSLSRPTEGSSDIQKFIALGHRPDGKVVLHKEELGVSETELRIKKRLEENAQSQLHHSQQVRKKAKTEMNKQHQEKRRKGEGEEEGEGEGGEGRGPLSQRAEDVEGGGGGTRIPGGSNNAYSSGGGDVLMLTTTATNIASPSTSSSTASVAMARPPPPTTVTLTANALPSSAMLSVPASSNSTSSADTKTNPTSGGSIATSSSSPSSLVSSSPKASNTKTSTSVNTNTKGKPQPKKIRISSSEGRTENLLLEASTTYADFQSIVEKRLGIPVPNQRLRSGFPPRELRPPPDPSLPVPLCSGDKVMVDVVGGGGGGGGGVGGAGNAPSASASSGGEGRSDGAASSAEDAAEMRRMLNKVMWTIAQQSPSMFAKGGDYYQQVMSKFGDTITDGTHVQFNEMPNRIFVYNAGKERLDLCLGASHIPVGPLTEEQERLAEASAKAQDTNNNSVDSSAAHAQSGSSNRASHGGSSGASDVNSSSRPPSVGLAVNRQQRHGGALPAAFSGRGHTLGQTNPPYPYPYTASTNAASDKSSTTFSSSSSVLPSPPSIPSSSSVVPSSVSSTAHAHTTASSSSPSSSSLLLPSLDTNKSPEL